MLTESEILKASNQQNMDESIGENIIKNIHLLRDWAKEQCVISLVNKQNRKIEILKREC